MSFEIELIVAKKKLTKTILAQIPIASFADKKFLLEQPANIYGFVTLNAVDYILGKAEKDLVKIRVRVWRDSKPESKELTATGGFYLTFHTVEAKKAWLENHEQILELGRKVHIYY